MRIKEVTYSNKYVTGPYLNHQPGFVAELEENEDPIEALIKLKALTDEFDRRVNNFSERMASTPASDFYSLPSGNTSLKEIQVDKSKPEEVRIGLLPEDILSCKDLVTIDSYRLLVKGKPDLEIAYIKRRREIVDAEKKDILDKTEALIQKNK